MLLLREAVKLMAAALLAAVLFVPAQAQPIVNLTRPLLFLSNPVMHVDTVQLDPATPATTTSLSVTLTAAPIASMGAIFSFRSSQIGGDVFIAQPSIAGTVTVTLPSYRPFVSGQDTLTIVYWSVR